MAYAILRTAKLKSLGSIGGSAKHTTRDRQTANADPSRTPENDHSGPSDPTQIKTAIEARLPPKRRSDAVLAIEYLVTASPDFFAETDGRQYFQDALAWLKDRHGPENVISAHVHRDETTPHMVVYVVPRDGDKLNAKKWLGGRAKLSQMQTDFGAAVGQKHGLERGIQGSVARHQDVKAFYAAVNKTAYSKFVIEPKTATPKVLKKGMFSTVEESPEMVAERITQALNAAIAPTVARAEIADLAQKRAAEMTRTATNMRGRFEEIETLCKPFIELRRISRSGFEKFKATAISAVKNLRLQREQEQSNRRGFHR